MTSDNTKLSSTVTVAKYKTLETAEDRHAIAAFIRERFEERYFSPLDSASKIHGFAIMAICCLAIETLESFYQGLPDTKNKSTKMFRDFFANHPGPLSVFGGNDDWFYKNIRCGILHQAETCEGWRIRRDGHLFDPKSKTINAKHFLKEVKRSVDVYAAELEDNRRVDLWEKFKNKMAAVCDNCK